MIKLKYLPQMCSSRVDRLWQLERKASKPILFPVIPEDILFIIFCPETTQRVLSKSKRKISKQLKERRWEYLKQKNAHSQAIHCFQQVLEDSSKAMLNKWSTISNFWQKTFMTKSASLMDISIRSATWNGQFKFRNKTKKSNNFMSICWRRSRRKVDRIEFAHYQRIFRDRNR